MTQAIDKPAAPSRRIDLLAVLARFAPLIFLVVLIAAFGLANERFVSGRNIANILTEVSIFGLLALGMTFVILTGGIDLSVGSLLALAGIVAAAVAKGGMEGRFAVGTEAAAGYGWAPALATAIVIGLAGGALQGLAITALRVPPFVVTLGGMSVFRGATLVFGEGGPISGFDEAYRWWGRGDVLGLPVPVLVFALFAVLCFVVLRYTRYGRHVYAVGGNPEAARLSGLNVKAIIASVYVLIGFFAGLAGFLLSARLNSAEAVAGLTYELRVIASVVIGGTSLFGGVGTIVGTVIGAILIGVLINGLVILNVSSYWQQIVIGIIIVLAVAFDTFAKSRRRG